MGNVKFFQFQKSQFHLIEQIKNKNKKRTRASLFQSSEDGKQEIYFMWPYQIVAGSPFVEFPKFYHSFPFINTPLFNDKGQGIGVSLVNRPNARLLVKSNFSMIIHSKLDKGNRCKESSRKYVCLNRKQGGTLKARERALGKRSKIKVKCAFRKVFLVIHFIVS